MPGAKHFQRCIVFLIICTLLVSTPLSAGAQQPPTIIAVGGLGADCSNADCPLTITFPPAGGAVTGNGIWQGELEGTLLTSTFTMTGTFAGGDGGAASGTWIEVIGDGKSDCASCITWTGSWNGNFYANGTGSGTIATETVYAPNVSDEVMESKIDDYPWQVTFSAQEFQAALAPAVTSEYLFNTYGIRVEDSFGGDGYEKTAWSDHELGLLNEVLKEMPPDLLKKMALVSIVRNKVKIDANGNQIPDVLGTYYPCGSPADGDCSGSSAVIRIFDAAASPNIDFSNDPNGDLEFKGSVLHEMIHALQYRRDQYSEYDDPANSPVVQNYMDATRPNTALIRGRYGLEP